MSSEAEQQAALDYELSLERLNQRSPVRSPPQTRRVLINETSSRPVSSVPIGTSIPAPLSDPLSQYREILSGIIGDLLRIDRIGTLNAAQRSERTALVRRRRDVTGNTEPQYSSIKICCLYLVKKVHVHLQYSKIDYIIYSIL